MRCCGAWSRAAAAALLLGAPAVVRALPSGPPRETLDLELGGAGWSRLRADGARSAGQEELNESASWLERRRLGGEGWWWSWGAVQELYSFRDRGAFRVTRLQDYAAQAGLEYDRDGEPVAALSVRPGFYFERTPSLDAFDSPIDFTTAVPLKDPVNGVLGVSHGRFYRRPVPIAGLTWLIRPGLRLNAVYPEPSLTADLTDRLQARVGGELLGAGFRADAEPGRPAVEHFLYRLGASIEWKTRSFAEFTAGAGYETARGFDFIPGPAVHGTGAPYVEVGLQFSR